MSLKDIAKKQEKAPDKNQEKEELPINREDNYEKLLSISMIEGITQYLYGCYSTFCKLKDIDFLDPEPFMEELKKIPKLNDDQKRKNYLKEKSKIGTFLIWYLYE